MFFRLPNLEAFGLRCVRRREAYTATRQIHNEARMDDSIVVERGVLFPLPKQRGRYPWRSMAVGDSFLMREWFNLESARNMGHASGRRIGNGVKFRAAREGERIRVWRIA